MERARQDNVADGKKSPREISSEAEALSSPASFVPSREAAGARASARAYFFALNLNMSAIRPKQCN